MVLLVFCAIWLLLCSADFTLDTVFKAFACCLLCPCLFLVGLYLDLGAFLIFDFASSISSIFLALRRVVDVAVDTASNSGSYRLLSAVIRSC